MSQVLVVEDDRNEALQYKIALESRKHKVSVTYDGEECRLCGKSQEAVLR